MADGRTGLSQALEQAFLTFAGAIAQNQVQNVPHIGSSVQQSASATVASSASVHVMPPVVSPAPTPRSETQTSSTRYLVTCSVVMLTSFRVRLECMFAWHASRPTIRHAAVSGAG